MRKGISMVTACLALGSAATGCASAPDDAGEVASAEEAIAQGWDFQRGLWGRSGETWVFDHVEDESSLTDHAEALVMGTPTSKGNIDDQCKGEHVDGPFVMRWKACESGRPCELYESYGHYQVFHACASKHEIEFRPSGECQRQGVDGHRKSFTCDDHGRLRFSYSFRDRDGNEIKTGTTAARYLRLGERSSDWLGSTYGNHFRMRRVSSNWCDSEPRALTYTIKDFSLRACQAEHARSILGDFVCGSSNRCMPRP